MTGISNYAGGTGPIVSAGVAGGTAPSYFGSKANYVYNPSLEVDATGWGNGGTVPSFFGQATLHPVSGTKSLRMTVSVPNNSNFIEVTTSTDFLTLALTPGLTYTFSMNYFGATANGGNLEMFIDWFTAAGASISTTGSTVSTISSGAQTISQSGVAPALAAKASLRTRWWGAGGGPTTVDVYIDAAMLALQGSTYFDGDSAFSAWTGTAHASASTSSAAAERFMFAYNELTFDKRKPVVIFTHGYGGDGWSEKIDGYGGEITHALMDYGYLVMGVDAGGPGTFGSAAAMASVDAARQFARSQMGVIPTKANLLGFSMGGIVSLNYAKFNPTLVNAVGGICPATELPYFHANSTFTAAIDADFSPNYVTNGVNAGYSPREVLVANTFSHSVPVQIWFNSDDPIVIPGVIGNYALAAQGSSYTNIVFRNNGNTGYGHSPFPTNALEVVGFFARYDPPWQ